VLVRVARHVYAVIAGIDTVGAHIQQNEAPRGILYFTELMVNLPLLISPKGPTGPATHKDVHTVATVMPDKVALTTFVQKSVSWAAEHIIGFTHIFKYDTF